MSKLQKPVIVHNGVLDLMFLYDKFYEPMPQTVGEFTRRLNSILPNVYDTKHLMNTRLQLKQDFHSAVGLSDIFEQVMQPDYKMD